MPFLAPLVWRGRDSNPQPTTPKTDAQSLELLGPVWKCDLPKATIKGHQAGARTRAPLPLPLRQSVQLSHLCLKMLRIIFCYCLLIIGIKHIFPRINIRCPCSEGGFQHRPRNPANVNAQKNMFDRYYCIKVTKKLILERYFDVLFWHYFVLVTSAHEDNFHFYPRSRAICK